MKRSTVGISSHGKTRVGFTLVELLVVMSIISLLVGILLPTLGHCRTQAKAMKVLSSGRQLMLAYSTYHEDFRGHLLMGYVPNAPQTINGQVVSVKEPRTGHILTGQAVGRYPARLAPYLQGDWSTTQVHRLDKVLPLPMPGDDYGTAFYKVYELGTNTTFGINSMFVGGDRDYGGFLHLGGTLYRPNYADGQLVFHAQKIRRPSQLVIFATAGGLMIPTPTEMNKGFHRIAPPTIPASGVEVWQAQGQSFVSLQDGTDFSIPYGFFFKPPAILFLDGHVAYHGASDLIDMRRWSNAP